MKNVIKIFSILLVAFILLELFIFQKSDTNKNDKQTLFVSTFALYDLSKYIAGNTLEVKNILPLGVDPHSFEPTPKLVGQIQNSDIVLYGGVELEPWIKGFEFKNRAIDISKHVKLIKTSHENEHDHEEEAHEEDEHEHHEGCSHGDLDPHYWLDFSNMKTLANLVTKELSTLNPVSEGYYTKNRDNYIEMLNRLEKEYAKRLGSCKLDEVILSHSSIGYLAKEYKFEQESISGLNSETKPSPKHMAEILEHIKEHNITTIFYESFTNDKLIKSIASQAKVNVELLQPLGNVTSKELKEGISYESAMLSNLEKLAKALECN